MEFDSKTKYFKAAENGETLTNEPFDENQPLVTRKYVYKSGATYIGQWLGGLRHGAGVMNWPDGAEYNGMWNLN